MYEDDSSSTKSFHEIFTVLAANFHNFLQFSGKFRVIVSLVNYVGSSSSCQGWKELVLTLTSQKTQDD